MNEAALRWKGRLGQLKALALLGGIVGVVLLIAGLLNLPAALNNDPARPAVRLRYRDDQGREQALVVSFDHAAAQADMINMLQKLGFAVGSGMLPGAP